ncbi:hypothetical protein FRC08_009689, partial [Ceratobasidium sp. 394]
MSSNPPSSAQHHKINALKGKENYILWKVQICNILFELKLEDCINATAVTTQAQHTAAATSTSLSSSSGSSSQAAPIAANVWKKDDHQCLVNIHISKTK